jgi:LuxR family maltose regulon positive regulatory protein
VRLHAKYGRAETALTHSAQLDALVRERRGQVPAVFVPWLELHALRARAYAALARHDDTLLPEALHAIEAAARIAVTIKRGGEAVEAQFIRSEVMRRQGLSDARSLRTEAISLAEAYGLVRLMREHGVQPNTSATSPANVNEAQAAAHAEQPTPTHSGGLLTLKEREVLALLSRTLSNKEIALAMGIGEQTIKWHMKNLFSKLNAASRKHAVARARMLGLVNH